MAKKRIQINRAPVLTLWAVIVAERLGYDKKEALTFGKAVAGLNAQSKGKRLGIYEEKREEERAKEGTSKSTICRTAWARGAGDQNLKGTEGRNQGRGDQPRKRGT